MKRKGGKRAGAGRPRTRRIRQMHLASCVDDWANENNRRRGSVVDAMVELYGMQRDDGVVPVEVMKTIKTDLRRGRRELREWQQFLRKWRRRHPQIF